MIVKPVFIVGCGRSGTTLLFDLLSQHPGLTRTTGYPDGEDHDGWIKHGDCVMAGLGNVHSGRFGNGINGYHTCLHMTAEDVKPETVRQMRDYYWQSVLKKNPSVRVVNKNPHLSNKLKYLLGIFPDAKIIHMVRDCEPTVASWLVAMKALSSPVVYWPEEEFPCLWLLSPPQSPAEVAMLSKHKRFFPGGGAELFIDYWNKVNAGIEKQMREKTAQLLVVRYEDMVSKPAEELAKIVGFCELPAHVFETSGIAPNTNDKHRNVISEDLRRLIRERSEVVRNQFGYKK